ncbi:unnamed protein product [Paramecium sonneborni]|uniref:Uncharacterized protein n=1 Tax=Paramecium sonneborni TaxID=65129 RepID=A0A8S1L7A5_9CILI|nr:unnamed protein product [Paramecium sonneborni]
MHLRSSSQGMSPQIEILQSERTLLNTPVTQSTLFKTFTEMPKAYDNKVDLVRNSQKQYCEYHPQELD